MEKGRIIKIISNQYTIQMANQVIVASPRGKLRLDKAPVVGDFVQVESLNGTYRIHSIEPRKNRLLRPAIANVDQALIVTSLKDPDFSEHLLNRLIFLVSLAHVEPILIITKQDLVEDIRAYTSLFSQYQKAGYMLLMTYPGSDDEELKAILKDKVSVLCGQSGAGKSSLLNRLEPSFSLQTQAISKALGRGKHTTRHAQLIPLGEETWLCDTPGFTSLYTENMEKEELGGYFPEFRPLEGGCRFQGCAHIREPGCAVKEALEEGRIHRSRYENYVMFYEELKEQEKRRY